MNQLKAIFGFSSNLPGETRKLSHRNENDCKEEENLHGSEEEWPEGASVARAKANHTLQMD